MESRQSNPKECPTPGFFLGIKSVLSQSNTRSLTDYYPTGPERNKTAPVSKVPTLE